MKHSWINAGGERNLRIKALDALRGLAALYVVVYHVAAMPEPDLPAHNLVRAFTDMGGTGVALFFILSAFSLSLTWGNHVSTGSPLRSFYLSRIFRIAPLFLFLLGVMVLKDQFRLPHRYNVEEVAWNASMLFGLSQDWHEGIVMGSWTIGVEVLFYAMFPLIAFFVRSLIASLVVLILACATTFFAGEFTPSHISHLYEHTGFLRQLPLFAFGCLLFHLWRASHTLGEAQQGRLGLGLLVAGLFGFALLFLDKLPSLLLQSLDGWYWSGIFYGLITLGLLLDSTRLLVNRFTLFLGTISYSLYLVHPFVVSRLYSIFDMMYAAFPGQAYFLCLCLSLTLAIPAAWLTYRLIEKPGIQLGKLLISRLRPSLAD